LSVIVTSEISAPWVQVKQRATWTCPAHDFPSLRACVKWPSAFQSRPSSLEVQHVFVQWITWKSYNLLKRKWGH